MVSLVKAIIALQALGATTARLNYPQRLEDVPSQRQLQSSTAMNNANGNAAFLRILNCHDCSCFTCDSATDNGDGTITVKVGHCKGSSISWMCCAGLDGNRDGCDVVNCSGTLAGSKCEGVQPADGFQIKIPSTTTKFEINTHDGLTTSTNADQIVQGVCGGNTAQGLACDKDAAHTAHCLLEFDVAADCGYTPPVTPASDPEPEPAADPEPEPAADPEPEPAADPEPEPAADPEPEPEPAADPEPEPAADPEPEPEANPPAPDEPTPEDVATDQAFSKGDPHFKTFGGEMYDYHGECDLVLLHNPDFKGGMGMDIHIRTKIEEFWSSVESAVIKLGDETLELRADPSQHDWIWFDGEVPPGEVTEGKWRQDKLSGFLVRYLASAPNSREAYIYLGGQEILVMKTFKSFMRIDINWKGSENYYNSMGLLGSHAHNGKRLGRDGKFIENLNEFGQEWQVRPEVDGKLFHSYEGAIVDKKCVLPPQYHADDASATTTTLRGRRLGASSLDQALVEKACNHVVDPQEKKACEYDVIATQDLNMASAW